MAINNAINKPFPIGVADGGTGVGAHTAYSVLYSGTTTTGPVQSASAGTSGQALTSGGAGVLPSYQNVPPPSASSAYQYISTATASNSASIDFTGLTGYSSYAVLMSQVSGDNVSYELWLRVSTDNGVTYKAGATDYMYSTMYHFETAIQVDNALSDDHILLSPFFAEDQGDFAGGVVNIINPGAGLYPGATSRICNLGDGSEMTVLSCGQYKAATAVDAIRIIMSTGVIQSGVFDLYGVL